LVSQHLAEAAGTAEAEKQEERDAVGLVVHDTRVAVRVGVEVAKRDGTPAAADIGAEVKPQAAHIAMRQAAVEVVVWKRIAVSVSGYIAVEERTEVS
jgi:hypothetical protein